MHTWVALSTGKKGDIQNNLLLPGTGEKKTFIAVLGISRFCFEDVNSRD